MDGTPGWTSGSRRGGRAGRGTALTELLAVGGGEEDTVEEEWEGRARRWRERRSEEGEAWWGELRPWRACWEASELGVMGV